jgi:hypothetical protein
MSWVSVGKFSEPVQRSVQDDGVRVQEEKEFATSSARSQIDRTCIAHVVNERDDDNFREVP